MGDVDYRINRDDLFRRAGGYSFGEVICSLIAIVAIAIFVNNIHDNPSALVISLGLIFLAFVFSKRRAALLKEISYLEYTRDSN